MCLHACVRACVCVWRQWNLCVFVHYERETGESKHLSKLLPIKYHSTCSRCLEIETSDLIWNQVLEGKYTKRKERKERERERERERQTDRQTDRQTNSKRANGREAQCAQNARMNSRMQWKTNWLGKYARNLQWQSHVGLCDVLQRQWPVGLIWWLTMGVTRRAYLMPYNGSHPSRLSYRIWVKRRLKNPLGQCGVTSHNKVQTADSDIRTKI